MNYIKYFNYVIPYPNGDRKFYSVPESEIGYTLFWNHYLHREDGPALEKRNGKHIWYWRGKKLSCQNQSEFERLIKLQTFW